MIVYLDLIFIINFAFDFILLLTTSILLKRNAKLKRIIFGALFGALSIFLLFIKITSTTLLIFKIVISVFMILITFGWRDKDYFIKNILYLYFNSIILGGFLYFLNIQFSYRNEGLIFFYKGISINFIFLMTISPIILYLYLKDLKKLKQIQNTRYKVDIYINNIKYSFNAFLDTGNQLYDPYKKRPINLIHTNKIDINKYKTVLVPFETLNYKGLIHCIKTDKLIIDNKTEYKNQLVGISKEKFGISGVDMILHKDLEI